MSLKQYFDVGSMNDQVNELITFYRSSIENVSFLVFVNIIIAAAGWLTQIKIANTLGKDAFGQFAFAVVIGTFLQVFIRFGLDRTLVRDLIHYPDRFSALVRASLFLRYILTIITISALLTLKLLFLQYYISWGVFLIITATAILSLDLQPVYDVRQNIKLHAIFFLFQKFFYLILIWIGIFILKDSFSILFIGSSLLISVVLYLALQHNFVMRRMKSRKESYSELANGIVWLFRNNTFIWFSAIAGLVTAMINQVILKEYCGYAELGGYAAAWQFVIAGTLLLDQVSRVGRPAVARITKSGRSKSDQIQFLIKYFSVMIVVVTPVVLFMIFSPEVVFKLLFRPEYHAAADTLPVMGIYLFLFAVGIVSSQYALSARLEKMYFHAVITGSILSILLCHVLIPANGTIGAAWALLISHGTAIIIYSLGISRHLLKQRSLYK
ncbi:MAG: oligosaccharide flippase family protein [Syntrophaceae bacterium]|nr:oligosaccharide flippase family protein [Syntrophaceae bacterium]